MDANQVVEIFVEQELITEDEGAALLHQASSTGAPIEQVLVETGTVSERGFEKAIADSLGAEPYDLSDFQPDAQTLQLIPSGLARLHGCLPISASGNTIFVALVDPLNSSPLEDLRFGLGRDIVPVVSYPPTVRSLITQHYGSDEANIGEILGHLGGEITVNEGPDEQINDQAVLAEANAAPIIKYVDLILDKAIAARASDIHFEPFESEFKIRYRVDGALYEMDPPPFRLALPVISRVKVMSNLNIAERRLPQDGRIEREINGRQVDLRVSTLPTAFGESVVLRVLDRSSVNLELETLGMPDDIMAYILQVIEKPNGIFIVTGPTGSGKTTTLYSCLRKINTIDSKLLTAEDPVEYEIDGIIQVP
ncbi:MAG: GspE/PulE family protein, partial [Terrimicrobiaceae bacterium]